MAESLHSFPKMFQCSLVYPGTKSDSSASMGRRIPDNFSEMSDVTVFFIGERDSALLPLWLMTHPNCSRILTYFPHNAFYELSSSNAVRQLRKRLYMIEKIKDANTLGLVVGTLSTLGFKDIIKRIQKLCQNANKKLYIISVGKINPYKLANFACEIDAFIFISCPYGIILDTYDYCYPVVSVFEAEVALNPSHQWNLSHGWSSEFATLLKNEIGREDKNATDISLITGRIRSMFELSLDNDNNSNRRTWNGLDEKLVSKINLEVEQGKSGVATCYCGEIAEKNACCTDHSIA